MGEGAARLAGCEACSPVSAADTNAGLHKFLANKQRRTIINFHVEEGSHPGNLHRLTGHLHSWEELQYAILQSDKG